MALFILFLIALYPNFALGTSYNNENYWNTNHELPAWFQMDGWGGFYGETVGGDPFTQKPVINDVNIRLQKFVIGDAFFYISDQGIINADSDLSAISIYFTLV